MNKSNMITGLIMALCELAVGILLLVNPIGFTSLIFIVLGIILLAAGTLEIISYFREEPAIALTRQGLAKGLAEIAAGLFCAFQSNWFIATFPLLTILYGVVILMTGFSKVQRAADMFRMKLKKWYLAAISAALSLVFAGIVLSNPFASTEALWIFVAVSLIVDAIVDAVVLVFRRKDQ